MPDEKCEERKECLKSNLDTLNQRIDRLNDLANFSENINFKIGDPDGHMRKEAPISEEEKEISGGSIPMLFTNGLNQIDEQLDRISSNLESISQLIG